MELEFLLSFPLVGVALVIVLSFSVIVHNLRLPQGFYENEEKRRELRIKQLLTKFSDEG